MTLKHDIETTIAIVHSNENTIDGIRLCFSFSQGLKFHVVFLEKCSSFWGRNDPNPAGLSQLDPTGGLPSPEPLICPHPITSSRSGPVNDCFLIFTLSKFLATSTSFATEYANIEREYKDVKITEDGFGVGAQCWCNKNAMNSIKQCFSFPHGLKFHDVYLKNVKPSCRQRHRDLCRAFLLDPTGVTSIPDP